MGKENMVSGAAVVGFSNEDIGIEGADKSKRLEVKRASRLAGFCYGFGDLASQFVWYVVGSYLAL